MEGEVHDRYRIHPPVHHPGRSPSSRRTTAFRRHRRLRDRGDLRRRFRAHRGLPRPTGLLDVQGIAEDSLGFLLDHRVTLYVWDLVLYLVGGIALVSLVLGVHSRLRTGAAGLSQTASVFGHLWAGLLIASGLIALVGQQAVAELAATDPVLAASSWSSVSVVHAALGGGIEIVGAAWVMLVSVAGIRPRVFGYGLGALGIGIGVAGAWTVVPPAAEYAAPLFGLGLIAWFV